MLTCLNWCCVHVCMENVLLTSPPPTSSLQIMGYAALGNIREEWLPHFDEYYKEFLTPLISVFNLGERLGVVSQIWMYPNDDNSYDSSGKCLYAIILLLFQGLQEEEKKQESKRVPHPCVKHCDKNCQYSSCFFLKEYMFFYVIPRFFCMLLFYVKPNKQKP